jgi:hypothetical protein
MQPGLMGAYIGRVSSVLNRYFVWSLVIRCIVRTILMLSALSSDTDTSDRNRECGVPRGRLDGQGSQKSSKNPTNSGRITTLRSRTPRGGG